MLTKQWPHPRHTTSSPADQSQSLGLRTRPGLPDQSLRTGTASLLTRTRRTDGKISCSPLPMHMARYTRQWHAAKSLLAGVYPVRSARQHAAPTSGKRTPKQHTKPQSPGPEKNASAHRHAASQLRLIRHTVLLCTATGHTNTNAVVIQTGQAKQRRKAWQGSAGHNPMLLQPCCLIPQQTACA